MIGVWETDDDTCPSCRRMGAWHGVIVEPGERERFACDECGHAEYLGGCDECGKTLPKSRRKATCPDCLDMLADSARMDSGEWVPNGRGALVFVVPGDAA